MSNALVASAATATSTDAASIPAIECTDGVDAAPASTVTPAPLAVNDDDLRRAGAMLDGYARIAGALEAAVQRLSEDRDPHAHWGRIRVRITTSPEPRVLIEHPRLEHASGHHRAAMARHQLAIEEAFARIAEAVRFEAPALPFALNGNLHPSFIQAAPINLFTVHEGGAITLPEHGNRDQIELPVFRPIEKRAEAVAAVARLLAFLRSARSLRRPRSTDQPWLVTATRYDRHGRKSPQKRVVLAADADEAEALAALRHVEEFWVKGTPSERTHIRTDLMRARPDLIARPWKIERGVAPTA